MIKCIIIEDEHLARQQLQLYVKQHKDLELVAAYTSAEEFLSKAQEYDYKLLLLDIGLPNIDGISLVGRLPEHARVIFTTAFSEYAVEAFNINATDYLLKPFNFERFSRAIEKVNSKPKEPDTADRSDDKILIKEGKNIHRLLAEDILYIKGLKEYVVWHTIKGNLITLHSLSHLSDWLKPFGFIQTHRSYIVNTQKVNMIEYGFVHLDKERIPIGRKYREQVKEKFM